MPRRWDDIRPAAARHARGVKMRPPGRTWGTTPASLLVARPNPNPNPNPNPVSPRWPASAPAGRHPLFLLATIAVLIAVLSRGQEVLIPIALALLLAFALTPVVTRLERAVGRRLSVALAVTLALGAMGGFAVLVKRQLLDLSGQVAQYSDSMKHKVTQLRGNGEPGLGSLSKTFDQVMREVDTTVAETRAARPVRLVPAEATAFERLQAVLEPVFKPIAQAVIVFVLVIFLLLDREDLRDRFVRLAGRRNVSLTTRTLDDAGRRIGRFLIVQSTINATFGVAVALGLLIIGVPYAPLWGCLAAVLRFVPFVGTLLGVLPPALLAFAVFADWWHLLATVGLFLALDLVAAYGVEPVAIGRRTGVSSMAMVVSAVFWTWLWGPPGLLLSTPLTVCLAVLGRQVPRLEFLAVLLSDEPALEAELAFYQRLLARDEDEAAEILERRLASTPTDEALDGLVVPALLMAERDRARGDLTEPDHQNMLRSLRAVALERREPVTDPGAAGPEARYRVLGVPAHSEADEVLWQLLAQLFDPGQVHVQALGDEALASEVNAAVEAHAPDLVVITSLPPAGMVHVRYLCKRLRARRPTLRIVVLRAGQRPEMDGAGESLAPDGASAMAGTLKEARDRAVQQLLLDQPGSEVQGVPAAQPARAST